MEQLIRLLSETLRKHGLKLATAESCTGGMISSSITELAGSSDVFDRGFVTYSNQSKIDLLGVSPATIEQFGAVSHETADEMASGAITNSQADVSIAVTGIAGPTGGTADKPVGLVYIAIGQKNVPPVVTHNVFSGDRSSIRHQATMVGIRHLLSILQQREIQ